VVVGREIQGVAIQAHVVARENPTLPRTDAEPALALRAERRGARHLAFEKSDDVLLVQRFLLGMKPGVNERRATLAVIENRGRHHGHPEGLGNGSFRIVDVLEVRVLPAEKPARRFGLLVEGDGDDHEPRRSVPSDHRLHPRKRLRARGAPRSPEIEDNDLAVVRGEIQSACRCGRLRCDGRSHDDPEDRVKHHFGC